MNLAQYLAAYGAKPQAPKQSPKAPSQKRAPSAPVVPSSKVKRQGQLWGTANGDALDAELQDALAVWWYAMDRYDGMEDAVWKRVRASGISDGDLRELLKRKLDGMGGTNVVWTTDEEGNRVAVSLFVSSRGLTVDIGTGRKRRTLSPARVLSLVRDTLDLPS